MRRPQIIHELLQHGIGHGATTARPRECRLLHLRRKGQERQDGVLELRPVRGRLLYFELASACP
ncbi:hypothetical protein PV394_33945 [Streptomyces sp. NE06-03E]|uniref:hypothetical protein n=1 Tax=unclassified Streptomyces TaxID=2593676 RepID=UPI0029BD6ED1|nr:MULTISPECIES: hypothetical protein [unclassified Streptomyces]MDX3060085.1 hypothetical protein [Streptomyces sp. NE06-03E]MDX3685822.1 hypothetical protein [Streptomyces sp. AK04-4c]